MNEKQIQLLTNATGCNLFDAEWEGGTWMVAATETSETIADFVQSSMNYAECTKCRIGDINGLPFAYWKEVQIKRGMLRRPLLVIDLGDIRIAVDASPDDVILSFDLK